MATTTFAEPDALGGAFQDVLVKPHEIPAFIQPPFLEELAVIDPELPHGQAQGQHGMV
jgi:hypothetical protein